MQGVAFFQGIACFLYTCLARSARIFSCNGFSGLTTSVHSRVSGLSYE
jgi:hypothetical protein